MCTKNPQLSLINILLRKLLGCVIVIPSCQIFSTQVGAPVYSALNLSHHYFSLRTLLTTGKTGLAHLRLLFLLTTSPCFRKKFTCSESIVCASCLDDILRWIYQHPYYTRTGENFRLIRQNYLLSGENKTTNKNISHDIMTCLLYTSPSPRD